MSDPLDSFARRLIPRFDRTDSFPDFESLAAELFRLQFEANPAYRRWCLMEGLSVAETADWRRIPAVPTTSFQELDMTSLPTERRTIVFHSSGTTGDRSSRHFHDAASLSVYKASALSWFEQRFLGRSSELRPIVSLTPPVYQAPRSSLVHMLDAVQGRYGAKGSMFAGRVDGADAWALDYERLRQTLDGFARTREPIAILGTAFNFVHLIENCVAQGQHFSLTESRVMETGGYKGRSRDLPKAELYAGITQCLGVPADQIIGEYGMCELSSQAYDRDVGSVPPSGARNAQGAGSGDPAHNEFSRRFRFPPWTRALVVSPENGREVPEGEKGLLRILDLANVWSVMAVQTEDLAVRRHDGVEILGRIPRAEARGCSLLSGDTYRQSAGKRSGSDA